ncbi:hypothetical protein HPP92_007189 [Vanilla planifolia]|uniref:Uncharacterized protein n=1 Tax=Vanilla planifolia TaxID=51239 RepID=A0A835V8G3_VANPL|nr:hypothetical protein HPP92_007189 [Vanilla planifolia]
MPVPCSCFKANVMLLGQMTKILANTTYDQEEKGKSASTRVKPSKAAGSTEQWGDEGDSAHGFDHTTKEVLPATRFASREGPPLLDQTGATAGGKIRLA